jgi:transcription elongation factor
MEDADLWMVVTNVSITYFHSFVLLVYTRRCQSGSEVAAVLKIMDVMINDGSVLSASAFPACPARIYVEGRDRNKIWQVCSRVPDVRKTKGMVLMTTHHHTDLTYWEDRRINAQTWVRLRRGSNKKDLAYVIRADVTSDRVHIAVVPRMAFTVPRNPNDNLRKRKRQLQRPDAIPFDPSVIEHVHGPDALTRQGDSYIFENKTFFHGMLILDLQSLHTLYPIPFPSLLEIKPFIEAGFVTEEAALNMTKHEELARILPGDYVRLIEGPQKNCRAMVVTMEDYFACVDIEPYDWEPDTLDRLIHVPIYDMQRILRIGDTVRVREDAVDRAGLSGTVVHISDDHQMVRIIRAQDNTRDTVNFIL